MSPTGPPPDRAHLAAMLGVFAHSSSYFGQKARANLLDYLRIAEDTIEAQAAMLRADLTDLDAARRSRHHSAEVAGNLGRQCDRLKNDNAALRTLALSAMYAAGVCETDAAETIRHALERTT